MNKDESAPFYQTNQGLGSFEADSGETMVRKAGDQPVDPFLAELRALRVELAESQAETIELLKTIAKNVAPKPKPPTGNLGGMR